jgi:AcrR family transcriptional regulator
MAAESGWPSVTMEAIARRVGFSKAGLYYSSKNALLAAAVEYLDQANHRLIDVCQVKDGEEGLRRFIAGYLTPWEGVPLEMTQVPKESYLRRVHTFPRRILHLVDRGVAGGDSVQAEDDDFSLALLMALEGAVAYTAAEAVSTAQATAALQSGFLGHARLVARREGVRAAARGPRR